jgi:acetyltransferase
MTQIDYAREMAFVALRADGKGGQELLGGARFFADPDYEKGEYAVLIRSDLKGQGLGWILMQHLISYAKSEGLKTLYGSVLRENTLMLQMCRELGFSVGRDPEDNTVYLVTLGLSSPAVKKLTQ